MFEFYGDISEKCGKYIANRMRKILFISFVIATLLVAIPMFIYFLIKNSFWIYVPILLIFVPIVLLIPPKNIAKEYNFPKKITIDDDIIAFEGYVGNYSCEVQYIDHIIDFGEWYHVFFDFEHKYPHCIIEKDLIKEGTIEDFEEYFKDKIIKKYPKDKKEKSIE